MIPDCPLPNSERWGRAGRAGNGPGEEEEEGTADKEPSTATMQKQVEAGVGGVWSEVQLADAAGR